MSHETIEVDRTKQIYLSSPSESVSNWGSWEYAFNIKLRAKKLCYLLDPIPSKREGGIEVSTQIKADDADLFNDVLIKSIHPDNIDMISHTTTPKDMWEALKSTHQRSTAGTRFFYIRELMGSRVEDESDAIIQHLISVSKTAGRLRKLCVDGMISIDDLEIASLTASLPSSFAAVLGPFERQELSRPKDAANAVRDELITRRNREHLGVNVSSSANRVKTQHGNNSNTSNSSSPRDYQHKDRSSAGRQKCDYCQNFHGGKCHKREIDELQKQITDLRIKAPAKSQVAIEDSDDTPSDYSDSVARLAFSALRAGDGRWNVDSGTTNCLVPLDHPLTNASPGSISIRTANNGVMKANMKGNVPSPIPGIEKLRAHQVDGLVEPLLSVSEVTDHGKGVVFLKD